MHFIYESYKRLLANSHIINVLKGLSGPESVSIQYTWQGMPSTDVRLGYSNWCCIPASVSLVIAIRMYTVHGYTHKNECQAILFCQFDVFCSDNIMA